ncbi:ATP-dependent DNA helicase RecG, partial [Dermatophilus congolensis]|nr:ATP-dependent DNA helicase RecG [Dermatophilus congolensis]MBO3214429.1 ATP-dependent DNA helicase RecG [Dermatophilus congolensis]
GGRERLEAVAGTTDGFELSRLDLLSRREGDVLGKRQSGGGSQLQFLRLAGREDEEIIAMARQDAASALAQDAELTGFVDLDRILDDHVAAESVDFLQKG